MIEAPSPLTITSVRPLKSPCSAFLSASLMLPSSSFSKTEFLREFGTENWALELDRDGAFELGFERDSLLYLVGFRLSFVEVTIGDPGILK